MICDNETIRLYTTVTYGNNKCPSIHYKATVSKKIVYHKITRDNTTIVKHNYF